ncbi:MAG: hypothetical protein KIT83_10425 [Bryobacterales bacterium]|nr:hypothetical protein [Bryobacterales bacterium]
MSDHFPQTIVLADDLTGALEMGVLARRAGLHAVVRLAGSELPSLADGPRTLVLDTDTRELTSADAVEVLRQIAAGFHDTQHLAILKKTDSLLRGNIAAELAALREIYPRRRLVYVPAYPLLGRCVRDGKLTIPGPSGPTLVGDVMTMLGTAIPVPQLRGIATPGQLQEALEEDASTVLVCDGQSQDLVEEMGRILRAHATRAIIAGPAGVFRSLFPEPKSVVPVAPPRLPIGVGFIGSVHPASMAQWEALATSPHAITADSGSADFRACAEPWQVAREAGKWLMLRACRPGSGAPSIRFDPLPEALYLSGGATAAACLRLLGCQQLEPLLELEPGVVLSKARIGDRGIPVITKSGAFGDAQTLVRILAILQGDPLPS